MTDAFIAVNVALFFIPIWIKAGQNLAFSMWFDKSRHKSTVAKSNMWYQKK